jgi:hypothetical protein
MIIEIDQVKEHLAERFGEAKNAPDGAYVIHLGYSMKPHRVVVRDRMIHIEEECTDPPCDRCGIVRSEHHICSSCVCCTCPPECDEFFVSTLGSEKKP